MPEEEYQKHVKALATKRLEQPKKLSTQNAKFWSEISSQQYHFDRGWLVSIIYKKNIVNQLLISRLFVHSFLHVLCMYLSTYFSLHLSVFLSVSVMFVSLFNYSFVH